MTQNTDFQKDVKKRLIDNEWSMNDLATEVSKRTGLFCDGSYVSHILKGDRNPPKIIRAICEILNLKYPVS